MDICNEPLLNTWDYIKQASSIISSPEKPPYHTAHISSAKNLLIGETTVQKWSITPSNPDFLGLGRFHPQEKYPSRARKRIQENEGASILYANHYVILPLLKILHTLHPGLEFDVRPEHRLMTWIDPKTYKEVDDGHDEAMDIDDDDDEEDCPRIKAEVRLDQVIAAVKDETDYIVLIVEHKAPGTLDSDEWTKGMKDGDGELTGNAVILVLQGRKYLFASNFNMIAFYDGRALVGLRMRWEDLNYWASGKELEGDVFFEENPRKILLSLIAMAEAGIFMQRLI